MQDPRAARPYLFSDGQNMYNRAVLVNVYMPASLGRRPILRYQVPQMNAQILTLPRVVKEIVFDFLSFALGHTSNL